uniref:F-box associated beta-propeller type 3 domain-containing protein n=1 Tax=Kalanchoe fedtschenkoi TaxID=63787 RepID=A0A7N0U364_KALFE
MFQTHNIKLLTSGSSSMEIQQRDMPGLPHDVLVQIASRSSPETLTVPPTRQHSRKGDRVLGRGAGADLLRELGAAEPAQPRRQEPLRVQGDDAGVGQVPNPWTRGEEWGSASASGIVEVKSDPIRYKIVRLSPAPLSTQTRFDYYRFNFHVFDSGTPGRWRRLEGEVRLEREAGEWVGSMSKMVTVNGNLHLLVGPNRVLAFDSVSEEWGFFATPEQENDGLTLKLLKHQGKLGLIMKSRTETTLWIMEDYGNKSWTRSEVDAVAALEMMGDRLGYDLLPGSIFGFRSDFRKLGWRTAAEAKGYAERQEAKERARENINAAVEK